MLDRKNIAELVGTLIFSLGINLSTQFTEGSQMPQLTSILFSLFSGITITRAISGGHLNGAVTFGFSMDEFYYKKQSTQAILSNFLFYYFSQVLGAFIACTISYLFYHGHILSFTSEHFNVKNILMGETFAAFIFVYNILIQSNDRFTKNPSISTTLIVLGLYAAVNSTHLLSAGCVNPSLALGHFLASLVLTGKADLTQTLAYLSATFLGSFIASWIYSFHFTEVVDQKEEDLNFLNSQ